MEEADTVSHDGGFACGEYAYTLSVTDVALCWPEFRALRNKARTGRPFLSLRRDEPSVQLFLPKMVLEIQEKIDGK
jgi:hypothetical protein